MATTILACIPAANSSHTGNTTETVLATYTLPANTLSANGILRITSLWKKTGTAGTRTERIRLGGTSGTSYYENTNSANILSMTNQILIYANGATNAQKGFGTNSSSGLGTVAGTNVTSSVDTTNNVDVVLSTQLSNSGDTDELESYLIEQIEP